MLGGAAVEDIISHGDDRPPGGTRRWLLVAAALAAVVALVVVEHLPHGRESSPPGNHVAGGKGVGQRSLPVRLRGPAVLPPSGNAGNARSWAPHARLPRTGAQPDWFWPAIGRVAPILGLPSDRFGYVFTRLDGGWAIQPDPPGPAGPPKPVFYLADRAQRASMVGSANLVAPAAVKRQMWLTSYPPDADLGRTPGVAQLYSASGAISAPLILPAGYGITQGTTRGLLLESLSLGEQANTDRLWNPGTGKVTRSWDGVVAVSATQVAYEPPCQGTCPVRVLDLNTGREETLALPAANTATTGRFSPDGRYLALVVSVGNSLDGTSAVQLDVAAMRAGRAALAPYASVISSDALIGFGWPGIGDDLVAEFSFSGRVQLFLWPPDGPSVAMSDVASSQDPAALIVG